jgi:hypothetical protein
MSNKLRNSIDPLLLEYFEIRHNFIPSDYGESLHIRLTDRANIVIVEREKIPGSRTKRTHFYVEMFNAHSIPNMEKLLQDISYKKNRVFAKDLSSILKNAFYATGNGEQYEAYLEHRKALQN